MKKEIEAATTIPVAFPRAREVVLDDPGSLFGPRCDGAGPASVFVTAVALNLGRGASVRQLVAVELEIPRCTDTGLAMPLIWRATGHGWMLPTFVGRLETMPDRRGTKLRLSGAYSVPLGVAGHVADRLVGRRLARASLAGVLDRAAAGLRAVVDERVHYGAPRREERSRLTDTTLRSELYVA